MEKLELKHKKRIEELLAQDPPVGCEMPFASLFAWRKARNMWTVDLGNTIALVSKRKCGLMLFGSPLGNRSLLEIFESVQKKTKQPIVACERIPENIVHNLNVEDMELIEDRDNFDYVYKQSDLAQLEGRKYHKKRNLIAQCLSDYDCKYEKITPELLPEIKEMQERWCADRDCGKTPRLCHEHDAIIDVLNNYSMLNVMGGAIRISGKIEAYTIGSQVNESTAAIHFEKAMIKYKGLYQVINQWFCQNELNSFEFVNREQDVGVEGIRKAKESYFPDHMIRKYVILHHINREEYEALRTKEAHCE